MRKILETCESNIFSAQCALHIKETQKNCYKEFFEAFKSIFKDFRKKMIIKTKVF